MMRALRRNKFTRKCYGQGYYDNDGKWVDGESTLTDFVGSLQPNAGRLAPEVQKVKPEGVRMDDVRIIYTETELRSGNERTGEQADDVLFCNPFTGETDVYEVFKVDPWYAIKRLNHFKALVHLKDSDKTK